MMNKDSKAGRREWIGFFAILLPTLVVTMDISILFLAIPHLSVALEASSIQILWITDIYGFMIAGFLLVMGSLGDRFGSRRLLMIGAGAFSAVSVVAAFSTSPEMLIIARVILGIAGATLMPATLSLISVMFVHSKQRSLAIGIWVTTMSVGISIGPLVGGLLLENFWWGSVFLVSVPFMGLLLVTAPLFIPKHQGIQSGSIDFLSVILSLTSMLLIVYGFKSIPVYGFEWQLIVSIIMGLFIGTLFIRRQRDLKDPLVDVKLFKGLAFCAAFVLLLFGMIAINGMEYLFPQFLQMVSGLSPFQAGLWTIPGAMAVIVGSMVAPILSRRISPAYVVGSGMVIAAIGFSLMSLVESSSSFFILVVGLVIAQLGIAPILVLGTDLVVGSAPSNKSGSTSAIAEISGELGIALGIAIMGSISSAVYRQRIMASNTESPGDYQDSLSGALALADQVPEEMLVMAREAFTHGFNVAAIVSSVLCLFLAILSVVMLRHVKPTSDVEGHEEFEVKKRSI